MSKWKRVKLKDISAVITKGTTPSNIGASFAESGIPYIKSEYLTFSDKYIVPTEPYFISAETHEKLKRSQLCSQDILLSMAGAYLGKSAILRDEDVPANTNQAVALIRIDSNRAYPDYVYYFLNQKQLIAFMNQLPNQSAQPNINLAQIGSLEVGLPEIEAQKRTAGILSSYDKLIENNRRQIALLEEAAQRLYKEWFVDLRFPGYETVSIHDGLPEGWKRGKLADLLDDVGKRINKGDRDGFHHYLPIDSIPSHSFSCYESKPIDEAMSSLLAFNKGDIVFGAMRPYFHKVILAPYPGLTRSTCFVLREKDPVYHSYAFMTLFHEGTIRFATSISVGTTMPYVRWCDLKKMSILLPQCSIAERFNRNLESLFREIELLEQQIATAREARDRLLPKLMSGEIEVI